MLANVPLAPVRDSGCSLTIVFLAMKIWKRLKRESKSYNDGESYHYAYINRQRKQHKITDKKYAVSAIKSAAVIFLRFNPAKYTAPI